MNNIDQGSQQPWLQPDQMDMQGMQDMQDMDFNSFLDIGDIGNLDLSSLDAVNTQNMGRGQAVHDFGGDNFDLHTGFEVQDFGQNQQWSQPPNVYRPRNHVPPTPNSYELQGSAAHYGPSHLAPVGAFPEQQRRMNKDDSMAFTPLVSPAVTPQDSHFRTLPEYTIAGAYFSPLTSPALQAQQQRYVHDYHTNPTTASNSAAASPLELSMDLDTLHEAANLQGDAPPRKSRRKNQLPHSAASSTRMRQSPIVKAQRRRSSHLSSVIPPREISNILAEAQNHGSQSSGHGRPSSAHDYSSNDSVSPEALPDSLMGPPPLPASAYNSPSLGPQSHSAPASATIPSHKSSSGPATPASLMSLRRQRQQQQQQQQQQGGNSALPPSGQFHVQSQDQSGMLEDLALPPAAEPHRPALSQLNTSPSGEPTHRMLPASKSTPRLAPSHSNTASPALLPIAPSPSFSGRSADNKKTPATKKRGSVANSSNLASPAIRPKISPSIKPLLPDGAHLNQQDQALLLASKSNYTHLLEGTRLPGVSYPESLSQGLTSKRTSHKIAEQGRRNRINEAIKEMQTLLPKSKGKTKAEELAEQEEEMNEKNGKGNTAEGRSANSKAATVESAIDYIKLLQNEKVAAVELLRAREQEMASLRKKLAEAGLGPGADAEAAVDSGCGEHVTPPAAAEEADNMEGVTTSSSSSAASSS